MNLKQIFYLLSISIFLLLSGCRKNTKVGDDQNGFLRNKSLSEIKSIVVGNWKIHYSYGGITGNIKTLMTNSYFKILSNDSIYLTLNNSLFAEDKGIFNKVNTFSGYDAYTLNFTAIGGTPYSWIVDQKIGDSLILDDNYINGNAYIMTKIP
jgi:hypothetical protein